MLCNALLDRLMRGQTGKSKHQIENDARLRALQSIDGVLWLQYTSEQFSPLLESSDPPEHC